MLPRLTVALVLLTYSTEALTHSWGSRHAQHYASVFARQTNVSTNGLLIQGFEWYLPKDGQHWNRLSGQLGKLSSIGVDRLWIPPATKAAANPSTGYDVYDLWDLGEFEQKGHVGTSHGTKEQLIALSESANEVGITLLADGVLNQRGGADRPIPCQAYKVNPSNRLERISDLQEIEAWVRFEYAGRAGMYSNKTWGCEDFSAVDLDNKTQENAVWKIEGQKNNFALDVSNENGNYDYLILADMAYANPSVQEDTKAWGAWITNELRLSGFRLDAAKHISRQFLSDWIESVKSDTGQADLLFIAEYLIDDLSVLESFVEGFSSSISVYDTPLQDRLHSFSTGEQTHLSTVFDDTWLAARPVQAVTYVNNHDTQTGQALGGLNVAGWFLPLAYSLILLRQEGYPCIFYGDIYGEFSEDGTFEPPEYARQVADLALARKYFAYGMQIDYFDGATELGWTRQGDIEHPEGLAIVLSNAQGGTQSRIMNVGSQHAGEVWSSLFGGEGQVTIDQDGFAEFVAGAGTINMYTRADASQREEFDRWDITIQTA